MVVLPPGSFLMGSSPADLARVKASFRNIFYRWMTGSRLSDEQPQHPVAFRQPFALGRYAVTREEFGAFVQATGYRPSPGCVFNTRRGYRFNENGSWLNPGFSQSDHDPVVCVDVADADAYIAWLNQRTRSGNDHGQDGPYRLPSEAQWEYAARGGTNTAHWWGDEIGVGYADCNGCGSPWDYRRTAPVERFPDNPFGISGVLGNAMEWTADCWNPDYRFAPTDGSTWSTGDCSNQVIRGGSTFSNFELVRSSDRSRAPVNEHGTIGFRVARDLDTATNVQ